MPPAKLPDSSIRGEGENGEGLTIGAGEIVLLPRNDPHLMGSDPNNTAPNAAIGSSAIWTRLGP